MIIWAQTVVQPVDWNHMQHWNPLVYTVCTGADKQQEHLCSLVPAAAAEDQQKAQPLLGIGPEYNEGK